MVTSTARPIAAPICWDTFTSPEAAPAISGSTSASDAEVRATMDVPVPPPIRISDTAIWRYDVSRPIPTARTRPNDAVKVPIAMISFCGRRRTRTRLVNCDDRKTETGMGRKASPACRGEYPWTSWRNWARK